jgi:hypothetical protein
MSNVQYRETDHGSKKSRVATGVAQFAGIMLSIAGVLEILQGISAIAKDNVFVTGLSYTYEFDVTTWGWIHLVVGLVAIAVGIAIVYGQTLGYLGGIAIAFLAALANFAFMPYYPIWSLVLIAFDVFVIWALCLQLGRDRVTEEYYAGQDTTGSSTAAAAKGSNEPGHPSTGTTSPIPH